MPEQLDVLPLPRLSKIASLITELGHHLRNCATAGTQDTRCQCGQWPASSFSAANDFYWELMVLLALITSRRLGGGASRDGGEGEPKCDGSSQGLHRNKTDQQRWIDAKHLL